MVLPNAEVVFCDAAAAPNALGAPKAEVVVAGVAAEPDPKALGAPNADVVAGAWVGAGPGLAPKALDVAAPPNADGAPNADVVAVAAAVPPCLSFLRISSSALSRLRIAVLSDAFFSYSAFATS